MDELSAQVNLEREQINSKKAKFRTEINEIENKATTKRIYKAERWFCKQS